MVKNYAKFLEEPASRIVPEGWLLRFLELQREGLTGHIEAAGAPFDRISWGKTDGENAASNGGQAPGWWSFEQTGYHLDGMERLSLLLRDRAMHRKAKDILYAVLDRADGDGYLGPENLKNSTGWNRWPHVVFFRALLAEYAAKKDPRILAAIKKHYESATCAHDRARDVVNVEPMLLTYLATGDETLLSMAKTCFASYNEDCTDDNCARAQLSSAKAYAHGVTYNEYSKLGALLYICTGDRAYLKPSVHAYKKIDRYQMLPDGLHCSNEFLLDNDYMQSHETCDVSDYTWALGYLLMATGDGGYADRIERCIFNAGIGSVEEHFRALQYFSCPNQLILNGSSNHNAFLRGSAWMSYRPNPGTECCAGNVHRFMPNYCARMWMRNKRSVAAALYGPSSYRIGAGERIVEDTAYPYEDEIRFVFRLKKPRAFPLVLRVPGWCSSPEAYVNGKKAEIAPKKGFFALARTWEDGDRVVLRLPSEARFVDYKDGVYVERGPLLYAYGMKGNRTVDLSAPTPDPAFPSFAITPDKPFNYALVTSKPPVFRRAACKDEPFTMEKTPCFITVSARKVPGYKITERKTVEAVNNLYVRPWKYEKKTGRFVFTPRIPARATVEKGEKGALEKLTLIPYGAAKVRLTVFPKLKE